MTDALLRVTEERRLLQERVVELENQHPEVVNYNELEERVNLIITILNKKKLYFLFSFLCHRQIIFSGVFCGPKVIERH